METRSIKVPRFLSVQFDHNAEVIYFRLPRYYDNMDLATTVCVIQYINADGTTGLYWVPYYDVEHYIQSDEDPNLVEPVILVPWAINGLATIKAGKVQFNLRFYKLKKDQETSKYTYLYNMSTQTAVGEILHGAELKAEDIEKYTEEMTDIASQVYAEIKNSEDRATTYWLDV